MKINDQTVGTYKQFGNFVYSLIYDAGHFVGFD